MIEIKNVERKIIPDLPRTVESQQLAVYIPVAGKGTAGISKYDTTDFIVESDGSVSLRYSERNIIKRANPLVEPSYVKLLPSEFEVVDNANPEYPYAEVRLNRSFSNNNPFEKRSLVQLKTSDFKEIDDLIGVNWPNDPFNDFYKLGFSFDSTYFEKDGNKIKPKLPKANNVAGINDGFGTVKIDNRVIANNYLHYDESGLLSFDKIKLKKYIREDEGILYIRPKYGASLGDDWVENDPRTSEFVAKRAAYWSQNHIIGDVEYIKDTLVPENIPFDDSIMYMRTLLRIDKTAIGLGDVQNLNVTEVLLSHNTSSGAHDSIFANYVSDSDYVNDIGDVYDATNETVKGKIANLTGDVYNIKSVINELKFGFLGYIKNTTEDDDVEFLNEMYPVSTEGYTSDTYLVLANTGTVWKIDFDAEPNTWYDLDIAQIVTTDYDSLKPTDANASTVMKYDSVASYGASNNWSPIDHTHPLRPDYFRSKKYNSSEDVWENRKLKITSEYDANANNFEIDLTTLDKILSINIPYVQTSQYLHNWRNKVDGTLEDEFIPDKDKLYKLWAGTTDEFIASLGGNSPDDTLVIITDDVVQAEGGIVDFAKLEDELDKLQNKILNEASIGLSYMLKPTNDNAFNWHVVDLDNYITQTIPASGYNFVGGAFKHSDRHVVSYSGEQLYVNGISVNIGNGSELYTTISNVKSNIKSILNGNYTVRSSYDNVATTDDIDKSIANIWAQIKAHKDSYDDDAGELPDMIAQLKMYPNDSAFPENAGYYTLTKSSSSDESFSLSSFKDILWNDLQVVDSNYSVSYVNDYGKTIAGSMYKKVGDNYVQSLSEILQQTARLNYFVTSTSDKHDIAASGLTFWVGKVSDYEEMSSGERLANCLYICYDE